MTDEEFQTVVLQELKRIADRQDEQIDMLKAILHKQEVTNLESTENELI